MYGYAGKILTIDLTKREYREVELRRDLIKAYIGGRGIAARLLYDELKPKIEPLSPDNILIFSTGPLCGTAAQSFSRWIVTTKSPLTGTYFRSVAGGWFGAELKFAGYDFIIVRGRAEKPTYVWIQEGTCEFRDATHIWGINTEETHKIIREETDPKARIACIGPAGERCVRFAAIVSDRRTASRGGVGAVMGAKNLKAIAIRGSKEVSIANPDAFKEAVKEQIEAYRNRHPQFFSGFQRFGTTVATILRYRDGTAPTMNFQAVEIPGYERFDFREQEKSHLVRHYACYGCMIRCGKIYKVTKGPYAGIAWDMPEYETQWAFGFQCGNINTESIIVANKLCDEYGLDTISTGNVIGFAMELFTKGIITKYDTDGLELRWGNHEDMITLIQKIALRDGFGNILAEGVKRASEIIGRGSEKYAMHAKGLELPAYDPRAAKALGLEHAVGVCGPNHNLAWPKQEILGVPEKVDPFALEGKAKITIMNENETAAFECGICCAFPVTMDMITMETYAKLLSAATGLNEFSDPKYLWEVGERIINVENAFNLREGFTTKEDTLPERILKEPVIRKPATGQVFELDKLVGEYYELRGWDKETKAPTKDKLIALKLEDIATELEKLKILK